MISVSAGKSARSLWKISPRISSSPGMRASAEENRPISIDPESPQDLPGQIRIHSRLRRIVFDAADVMNPLSRNAERNPAFDIFRFLNANEIETTKGRRDQEKETAEPPFRSLR